MASTRRDQVLTALERAGGPLKPPEIAKRVGVDYPINPLLYRMAEDKDLKRLRDGSYDLARRRAASTNGAKPANEAQPAKTAGVITGEVRQTVSLTSEDGHLVVASESHKWRIDMQTLVALIQRDGEQIS